MTRIDPGDWRPRGIPNLEPQAWRALRHTGSTSIVAGPGSGKTEFLAQRVAYLLETATCPAPYRILAISFKTDAASNLAERVHRRCPPELARRFVSLTFDAFTKGLVDRFLNAIPTEWRPTPAYDVAFPSWRDVKNFLTPALFDASQSWRNEIAGIEPGKFESQHVGSYRLPITREAPRSGLALAIDRWWQVRLRGVPRSSLTFTNFNRLAELLLRSNSHIRRALRVTYPFVFVDEFQDTTYAQYDFLLSAFSEGSTTVTVVGDDKQKIMTWAGAKPDVFRIFEDDFAATRIPLTFNFRSSPDLVHIQHVVAQALDGGVVPGVSQTVRTVDGDVAQVWRSPTKTTEIRHLAEWLVEDMFLRDQSPRDYALLVRQKSDDFEAELIERFRAAGLSLRNESHVLDPATHVTVQDLMSDDLCRIVVGLLRLGSTRRSPEAWRLVSATVAALRGADPEDEGACHKAELGLTKFLKTLRQRMTATPFTEEEVASIADQVFAFLDLTAVSQAYPEYAAGNLLTVMVEAFKIHLAASASSATNWQECLDTFEALFSIPLMTVHKSKGLEYDTIIFIGLDDKAWWAHKPGDREGLATFFVALSRAKQRAIFSFCQERGRRQIIAELYQLLTEAGVPEIAI